MVTYKPPKVPKSAPKGLKKTVKSTYSSCRRWATGKGMPLREQKTRCSAIAWSSGKRNYKKVRGKWVPK